MWRKLSIIISCLILVVSFATGQRVCIIPQPLKVTEHTGNFVFNTQTKYVVSDKKFMPVANAFINSLNKAGGIKLHKASASASNNALIFKYVPNLKLEEYKLSVTPTAIVIESSYPNGAFYAVQTLYQLLPADIFSTTACKDVTWTVPCCDIADAPRFKYRGMHLDVTCHFFDVEYIKRYIDLMSMHKFNVFHWHLTDDQGWRIEIKKYPKLTQIGSIRKETVIGSFKSKAYDGKPYGGFYTQEQIKDIVKYAADRFVTILPEIEMPGHALAAITCYPELSCGLEKKYELATRWGVFPQVYCPKDHTFSFLEDVLTEVMSLFPSKLIHIGGDECPKSSWKRCPHCQALIKQLGLKDEFELQSYFVQRIEKFVNSKGRQIIGWDEILQGGLAPNASVMSWLGEKGGIKAAQQHHNVVMCPYQKYYMDYYQADPATEKLAQPEVVPLKMVYDYNPVPDTLNRAEQKYIMGVQACVWTEYLPNRERVEYMAYPRCLAVCEAGWSSAENKNWNSFAQRLEKHFKYLEKEQVGYCHAFYDVAIATQHDSPYSNIVTLTVDAPNTQIRYTLDGTEPNSSSAQYILPFVINSSEVVKAAAFRGTAKIGKVTMKSYK